MYDVITIGSALTDIFIKSSQFAIKSGAGSQLLCQLYGDKMEVDTFDIFTGGGGSNTAVGFARQGFRTACIAETGRDILASIVIDDFHTEKVATNLLIQEKKEKTGGSVILVGSDGGRSVMVHRGASSMLDPSDIPADHLKQADWIHLSSISGRLETLYAIGAAVQGKKKLSWNPGKGELRLMAQGSLPIETIPCQILLVNKEEWQMLESYQRLLEHHIPEIIVTDGGNGGTLRYLGQEHTYRSANTTSIDDTGAGDAFGVGYVTSRLRSKSPQEAVAYGAQNAGSVVEQMGAKAGLLYTQD